MHRHQAKVSQYAALLRNSLDLDRWHLTTLVVDVAGGDEGNDATCIPVSGRYSATIEVRADIVHDGERLRRVLVHELLHLLLRDLIDLVRYSSETALGPDSHAVYWEAVRQSAELVIDAHAVSIAPLLPPPPDLDPDLPPKTGATAP